MTEEKSGRLHTFLNSHQDEIINWVNSKVKTQFNDTADTFDRTANVVTEEYPYGKGKGIDNTHRFLTTAIMSSLWCGWFSQARTKGNDPNFRSEYIEEFRRIINEAFDIGVKYADIEP